MKRHDTMKKTQTLLLVLISGMLLLILTIFSNNDWQSKLMTKVDLTKKKSPMVSPSTRAKFLQEQCRQPLLKLVTDLATNRRLVEKQILVDSLHSVAYCNVPKVGSKFWFSVFAILADGTENKTSPYTFMNKNLINIQTKANVKFFSQLKKDPQQDAKMPSNLFLFVRDPYERLFSAYLNKFVEPNYSYWTHTGRSIMKYTRAKASDKALKCGHNITFTEFLKYFVATETSEKRFPSDNHWAPIYKVCSPCHLAYKFIGKTETFPRDTEYILGKTKLDKIVFHQEDKGRTELEIEIRISRFLNLSRPLLGDCLTVSEMVSRLWVSLHSLGYLNQDAPKPELSEKVTTFNLKKYEKILVKYVMGLHRNISCTGSKEQFRQAAITAAYQTIPTKLLHSVREILLPDFLLFDYNPFPDYIYKYRT